MLKPNSVILINHLLEPPGKITGVSSYLFSLLAKLIQRPRFRYVLATCWEAKDLPPELTHENLTVRTLPHIKSMPLNVIRQMIAIRRIMRETGASIELSCNPIGCFVPLWPRAIVVHDLYFEVMPSFYKLRHRLWWQALFPLTLASASRVICVSESTRKDLLLRHPEAEHKAIVIYEAATLATDNQPDQSSRKSFGLFVSNISPNKNVGVLVEALSRLSAKKQSIEVFHVGRDETRAMDRARRHFGTDARPIGLGTVTQESLKELYAQASFLVCCSTCEGFGLPVIEAQAFGVPVIASDIPVLHEVAGEGACFFKPNDAAGLASLMSRMIADAEFRRKLSVSSLANAKRFSWERAAAETETLLGKMLPRATARPQRIWLPERRRITRQSPAPSILFYTHALAGGGAERVFAVLAAGFARRGYRVSVAVDYNCEDNKLYLDPGIRCEVLGGGHLTTTIKLARLLWKEKPSVTFSAIGVSNLKHCIAAMIARRWGRAILSYHGYYAAEPQRLSRIAYWLTPLTTRLCARTICVSDCLHQYVLRIWRADPKKTMRIYNPVVIGPHDASPEPENQGEQSDRPAIVLAAGRFVPNKNFLGLVRAFARVDRPDAHLLILGEGPDRALIEAEVERLGLQGRVSLPGYIAEPWKHFNQASCFVVSSRSESFSMVVVEALAHGLPVVSTDCYGPREILADGKYGRLIAYDDEAAMAAAITEALNVPGDRAQRMERAREFSLERGLNNYERLIDEIAMAESPPPADQLIEASEALETR